MNESDATAVLTVWERLITSADFSPDTARAVLALKFSEPDHERIHELSRKAREGRLTVAEQLEMDAYGHVGAVLSVLWAKARQSLKPSEVEAERAG